jgi:GntR family transcriptional regulator/MocR family aminotransferase
MGAQNALWLTAQVLLTQRRTAVVEDPCYHGLRDILDQSRCHTHAVPVDARGLPPGGALVRPRGDDSAAHPTL